MEVTTASVGATKGTDRRAGGPGWLLPEGVALTLSRVTLLLSEASMLTVKQNLDGPVDKPSSSVTEAGTTFFDGVAVAFIVVPPGREFRF